MEPTEQMHVDIISNQLSANTCELLMRVDPDHEYAKRRGNEYVWPTAPHTDEECPFVVLKLIQRPTVGMIDMIAWEKDHPRKEEKIND